MIFALLELLSSTCRAENFLVIGDSNANSTWVDDVWADEPVRSGYRYVHNGVESPTWPDGSKPGVGCLPYLLELDSEGLGYVVRRGKNGAKTTWPGTIEEQWLGAVDDVLRLNAGDPDRIIIFFGANDSNKTLDVAQEYISNMRILLDEMIEVYPDAVIFIVRERTTSRGAATNYVYLESIIYDSIDQLLVEYPQSRLVDTSPCDLFDAIHFSVGGRGGGQECVAEIVMGVRS